jgi:hypothetical protein
MKYYLHDSNSFSDEKITELYLNFGYEGLGLFYTTLEKLALQEKPIKTNVLKSQLNVGKKLNKCWEFMESLGILSSNNGETFSKQLLNFSENYQIKKEKNKEKIKQWRENQTVKENVTSYEPHCNPPKVKLSKVNISKVKESKLLEQKNISLTHIEYEKLVNEFSETLTLAAIKFLSDYKIEKGYKTKNDNLTIRRWVIDAVKKNNVPVNQTQASKFDKIVETVNKAHEQIRKRHEANNG